MDFSNMVPWYAVVPVLSPADFKNRSSPHLKWKTNEAEWRRQLFDISLYFHHSVGLIEPPVLKTEQTCINPRKAAYMHQQVLFTAWSISIRKLGLAGEGGVCLFFLAGFGWQLLSVQISSRLELRVCSGREGIFTEHVDFGIFSISWENLSTLNLSHCAHVSEWATRGGDSSTYSMFSEAL